MTDAPVAAPSGILLLDKPSGITSNAALSRAKRILGIKKAGHTGTLDPMASGLLVLCFGEATKVSAFLLDGDKRYQARIRLGATTSTDDAEGEVLDTHHLPTMDVQTLEAVLAGFRGPIEQVPPMVSALKHEGQRLYKLARAGQVVERPARPVTIHSLTLERLEEPLKETLDTQESLDTQSSPTQDFIVDVQCSKGTYIRSLARDIGSQLGCGGHLAGLRRTASAPFHVDEAVNMGVLESLSREDARALLRSPDQALIALPAVSLDQEAALRVMQGQRVIARSGQPSAGLVRLYSAEGFVGVGELTEGVEGGMIQPKRLMSSPQPSSLSPGAPE